VILLESTPVLAAQLEVMRETLGPDVPVWIGGKGATSVDAAALPPACLLIGDRAELEQRLDILPR
jgi:hypothetical protein